MNIIFLDCDGVLNDMNTEHTVEGGKGGIIGFDHRKIYKLRQIVQATDARIVLSSSWKHDWEKDDKSKQNKYGDYLDAQLARERLSIFDRTYDPGGSQNRGQGILNWLASYKEEHPEESINFIILDDEIFDFKEVGLESHLIKTHFYRNPGGLLKSQIEPAIKLLLGEL